MAKDKTSDIDLLKNETNRTILADHYGLTPEFIKDNEDKLNNINKLIDSSLKMVNDKDPKSVTNTYQQLQKITKDTFISDTYEDNLNNSMVANRNSITQDGFRMISKEIDSKEDTELFNFHASVFASYRNLVSEYRNISRLIPEIDRCADMKSRDVLSINEITKRSITNLYKKTDINTVVDDNYDSSKDPINQQLTTDVIDRYDVEDKLSRYFKTSLIEGAKPVVVYPFKDIIQMAKYNEDSYANNFNDYRMKKSSTSQESFVDVLDDYRHKSQLLINKKPTHIFETKGIEDSKEDYTEYVTKDINRFCSSEDFKEYCQCGLEDIKSYIEKKENENITNISLGSDINKLDKINEEKSKFRELSGSVKIDSGLTDKFKNEIYNAISTIDQNVEFYDQTEAPMEMAINNLRRIAKFTAYHEDPNSGVIAYGADLQNKYHKHDPIIDQDSLHKFKKDTFKSVLDDYEDDFSSNTKSILNDCLIKEYDAEDVIPVIISGKHVGYYIIETSPYTGNQESVNKRNCNFTDMFINLGINNDYAMSPSPATSGSFSAGVSNVPMGGVGPMSDVPTLGITGAGSMAMAGGLDISGFDVGPEADDATHRNNVMKKIIFNVLKEKLKNNDLDNDKSFVDTVMSLIRDGAIVQNKVKIVYVPEKYMCYFSPGLDGNGIPQSFMKNCLFTCYEKILVNMNNIMTRLTRTGTKDKITLNVGKAKNMGYSVRAIENALTTRRLNVESPFTSLSRVLKSASLSETVIVPIYDGEKLYEYENIQQTNQPVQDDDLESKLTNQIVTSLKCPITIINPYQEEDFASIAASRNAEYRFDIIKMQKRFGDISTKFVKLLTVGSGVFDNIKKGNKNFKLSDIEVIFSPPENLNMKNANDIFGTVSSYIDNVISILINPDDDTDITKQSRFEFKQKLYNDLFPGLNLDKYKKELDTITKHSSTKSIANGKSKAVNDFIQNSDYKSVQVNGDGTTNAATNAGIGNNDSIGF